MFGLVLASDNLAGGDRICAKVRFKMAQIRSWTVSDALWNKIEPLVPARKRAHGRKYRRKRSLRADARGVRLLFAASGANRHDRSAARHPRRHRLCAARSRRGLIETLCADTAYVAFQHRPQAACVTRNSM